MVAKESLAYILVGLRHLNSEHLTAAERQAVHKVVNLLEGNEQLEFPTNVVCCNSTNLIKAFRNSVSRVISKHRASCLDNEQEVTSLKLELCECFAKTFNG